MSIPRPLVGDAFRRTAAILVDMPGDIETARGMPAHAKLNLAKRILNRLGRPLGVAPFPIAWGPPEGAPDERRQVFETIYHKNWWHSSESVSGRGSQLRQTARYRKALIRFLEHNHIRSMFDAPCGDLNWMPQVLAAVPIRYVGGDIADAVVAAARSRCQGLDLRTLCFISASRTSGRRSGTLPNPTYNMRCSRHIAVVCCATSISRRAVCARLIWRDHPSVFPRRSSISRTHPDWGFRARSACGRSRPSGKLWRETARESRKTSHGI